jgi:hypothetical protein
MKTLKYTKPEFTWDSENLIATCTLTDNQGRHFVGAATCHPNDADMSSERTGCELAFRRAKLEYLRTVRDAELKPALKALKHLYGCMTHSTNFEANSYEARMIRKHIYQTTFDLATIKEEIAYEYQGITDYIKGKDKVYNYIRNRDAQVKND